MMAGIKSVGGGQRISLAVQELQFVHIPGVSEISGIPFYCGARLDLYSLGARDRNGWHCGGGGGCGCGSSDLDAVSGVNACRPIGVIICTRL